MFYKQYQARLDDRKINDFNDIVGKAIEELRDRPLDDSEAYALIVVDEVQDFTLMELKLVHREAVLRFVQRIEANNTVDDLDGGPGFVLRDSETVLPGGPRPRRTARPPNPRRHEPRR
ncbi:hypothetical protein OG203_38005 [Nocardia sp. NBC_01499]|uniref:UvrD-helicase domain-containing protein n=1 Tax=Nocardia sp. NBC_01499 TaxID=2903597 RepID=UPI0038701CD6